MSEMELLEQSVTKLLTRHCGPEVVEAAKGDQAEGLWRVLEDAGMALAGVPEEAGGVGGGWPAAAAVLRQAGRHAAPVPLAETIIARMVLAEVGLELPDGPLTIAPAREGEGLEIVGGAGGLVLRGDASRVPWGRCVGQVLVVAVHDGRPVVAVVRRPVDLVPGLNLAAEPRDHLRFADVPVGRLGEGLTLESLGLAGALTRSVQMVGALERSLELTVEYAGVRKQFGRPIGQFQAIQQECARFAAEVAAAGAAVEGAVAAMAGGDPLHEVAAAKIRVGTAASIGARIAHQVHGAIGVTEEHRLHHYTTRLWSWRDEFGSERSWARRLGDAVASGGPGEAWDRLARPGAVG